MLHCTAYTLAAAIPSYLLLFSCHILSVHKFSIAGEMISRTSSQRSWHLTALVAKIPHRIIPFGEINWLPGKAWQEKVFWSLESKWQCLQFPCPKLKVCKSSNESEMFNSSSTHKFASPLAKWDIMIKFYMNYFQFSYKMHELERNNKIYLPERIHAKVIWKFCP